MQSGGQGASSNGDRTGGRKSRAKKAKEPTDAIESISTPLLPETVSEVAATTQESKGKKIKKTARKGMEVEHATREETEDEPKTPNKGKQKLAANVLPSSPSSPASKKRVPIAPGTRPPPEGWREVYELVTELRLERDAPVDWAGCEVVGKGNPFHILVALMLSSQTKDQVVHDAMRALQSWERGGLTVDSILDMTDTELDTLIAKVGFHNNKTKYIKQSAQILKDKYGSKVPQTAEDLCSLPGIGPKMAYLILSAAYNIHAGIGVDTHMHRIFNVLQWVNSKTPEQTREQLEAMLTSTKVLALLLPKYKC